MHHQRSLFASDFEFAGGQTGLCRSGQHTGWFGRWFISSYIEPSPQSKHIRAPKKIVPGARVEPSVLDRFLRSNQAARELVRHARDYDVNLLRFRNPFIPVLRFTVGTGLEIVSRRERRHLLQAERAKRSSGFPG